MRLDRRLYWKLISLTGLGISLAQCGVTSTPSVQPEKSDVAALSKPRPMLVVQDWPDSGESNSEPLALINVVTIPANYPIEIAVSDDLKTVEEFAIETKALAVLNGGFFDPNNGRTTSFVTINGVLEADPRNNRRLVDNPELADYMEQILNRSEFRRYICGDGIRYDITMQNAPLPENCKLHSALGAGPQLLPEDTSQQEGFIAYSNDTLIRDALGSQQPNARSAIGIKQDGSLVWVMVAQRQSNGGMTMAELADFMKALGVTKALNLDGGSSSSLYFDQQLINGLDHGSLQSSQTALSNQLSPLRPVKSVLYFSVLKEP